MKETITVTQADIKAANTISTNNPPCIACPIAQAVRRLHPDWKVRRKQIDNGLDSGAVVVDLPSVATAFIDAFDEAKPVKPFSFTIEVPDNE